MEKIVQALKTIGFKKEEIEVYLICLQFGSASVFQLSQRTKIPRTTVYLVVDSLISKGLLTQTMVGKRKRFVVEEPARLIGLFSTKQEKISQAITEFREELPQLTAIYNLNVQKPKIKYYEGVNGVKMIYEDTLSYPEILVHCMTQEGIKRMGDYLEKYFKRLKRWGIKSREIVSDSQLDRKYQKDQSTSRNQIICISQKYITNTDCFIYGDKIAMITYKGGQPVGILIEDSELAKYERIHFDILWLAAKKDIL